MEAQYLFKCNVYLCVHASDSVFVFQQKELAEMNENGSLINLLILELKLINESRIPQETTEVR